MAGGVCGGGNAVAAGVCMAVGWCVAGVCAYRWGVMPGRGMCVTGETATAADGTHPTGMHSC